jgi:hypothetical protein
MPDPLSDSPPKLASTSETDYAPISWTAVASLGVAGLFAALLVVVLLFLRRGQPLIEPWLLIFPTLAVVLAFVARRQILASEGTRTGERYATLGWWLGMLGGLGYVMYLGGVEFAIRKDAERTFTEWTDNLADLNPTALNSREFYTACYMSLPPGSRTGLKPQDTVSFERALTLELAGFRQLDIVRLCARNRGKVSVKVNGVKDWQQRPSEISATLTATVSTPEGEHGLVVPMRAVVNDKQGRDWQVIPSETGYIKTANLTKYGWQVAALEADGRQFVAELLTRLASPDQGPYAYMAYVQPGSSPAAAGSLWSFTVQQSDPRAAVTGNLTRPEVYIPLPAGWLTRLQTEVFTLPGGGKLPPDMAQRLLGYWLSFGRFVPPRSVARANPDQNPTLLIPPPGAGVIEMRHPIEILLADPSMPTRAVARGLVVIQVPADAGGAYQAELAAAREAANAPRTNRPGDDIKPPRLPWRVVRIETDLKPLSAAAMGQDAGMAGPGG